MSLPKPSKGGSLPVEVIQLILAKCDDSSLYAWMQTSRDLQSLAAAVLYDNITISSYQQLNRFSSCVRLQSMEADQPGTSQTSCFTLALRDTFGHSDSSLASAQDLVDVLQHVPRTHKSLGPLFPKLDKARLYPISGFSHSSSPSTMFNESFLSRVQHLHLPGNSELAPYAVPGCRTLGIHSLRSVHIHNYDLAYTSAVDRQAADIWTFIAYQRDLTTITLHLDKYPAIWAGLREEVEAQVARSDGLGLDAIPELAAPALWRERLKSYAECYAWLSLGLASPPKRRRNDGSLPVPDPLLDQRSIIPKLRTIALHVPTIRSKKRQETPVFVELLKHIVAEARSLATKLNLPTLALPIVIRWNAQDAKMARQVELPAAKDESWGAIETPSDFMDVQ